MVARLLAAALLLSGCGGTAASLSGPSVPQIRGGHRPSSYPITHVVLLVQENRTFNNLFATFPGAAGTTTGYGRSSCGKESHEITIPLKETPLADKKNLNHLYKSFRVAYNHGRMNGFNCIKFSVTGKAEGSQPYQYVNPSDVAPYWTFAQNYALADHMFQTQGSGSFTAHQDLIRGGTEIDSTESLVDDPTSPAAWGCTSPKGTVTSLITTTLKYEAQYGPFPCTNQFPSSGSNYKTLADTLDAAGITWKYYAPAPKNYTVGGIWNAFLVIDSVWGNQTEWKAHISTPTKKIFKDITNGTLPQMSWVIPDALNSDHPGYTSDTGPSWVTSVVDAIGGSQYWNSTAVIILWDDWGGFYDAVKPPPLDKQGGPGFRVGMIVVSPYVPAGEISGTTYEFGSIIKFIEQIYGLPSLGTTDQGSTSISDMFKFEQKPRKFKKVASKYSREYFLRQKPSGLPVDTE